ncbi:NAD(P)/FAD-dependent oxidoreductase [Rhodococcus opacus]|uniref:Pyridine nucleotide-disulfide oxidoreductase n=1 Tax=Rhodococcus opacus TaxID=37919 RepID=A0A2S8J4J1_RHOOP|nr:FAD-dependent oxidoreductase [Rhodococcus opacus]PQP21990.1 pyridine nucleotide-disulfide oxidoreductase [Rhodococcus opacus]
MNDDGAVVVVGAGHGGFTFVTALRQTGFTGEIHLIGDENELPYQRPPLSKEVLLGQKSPEALAFRPEQFYEKNQVTTSLGDGVVTIDRDARSVRLRSGRVVAYRHLVLALGASAVQLPIKGSDLPGVRYLRSLADARHLAPAVHNTSRLVIVGGGLIGMEVAAAAADHGVVTTVVEASGSVMARAVSTTIAKHLQRLHRARGVDLRLDTALVELRSNESGSIDALVSSGEVLTADAVLISAGARPRTALATDAGLAVDDGIEVDEHLTTSDPNISAIGDCARFAHSRYGRIRIESVQNATDQARHVAARLAGSQHLGYGAVPWFWTTQFGTKVQMAGICTAEGQQVTIGDIAEEKFSVYRFVDDRLVCVESINAPGEHMAARRLLAAPDPITIGHVTAVGFDPKQLAKTMGPAQP